MVDQLEDPVAEPNRLGRGQPDVVLDVEVTDEVTDPKEWGGNVHRGAKATGKVSRADFGLKWNTALEKGGVVVGDEVTLSINAELIKAAPAAAKK